MSSTEEKEEGGISMMTYYHYLRAGGGPLALLLLTVVFLLMEVSYLPYITELTPQVARDCLAKWVMKLCDLNSNFISIQEEEIVCLS